MQGLALGAKLGGGLTGSGAYRQRRDVESLCQIRGDQVAVAHATEGFAIEGLIDVFGVAVGRHDQCAVQLKVGQGGGAGEPSVGEDFELQFDEAADHGWFVGLQGGLDAQFGFGGYDGCAEQADENRDE
ncbi:hypothetical protein D3C71_1183340 [compost metagenome]